MICHNQLLHTIEKGDTLYSLAIFYHTTVKAIMEINPKIDPYNLRIGSQILICPGEGFETPQVTPVPPIGTIPPCPPCPPCPECPNVYPVPPIGTLPPTMPPVTPVPPIGIVPPCPPCPECPVYSKHSGKQQDLTNKMRKAWEQHIYWTRMLLISIAERLPDQNATAKRLMQNPQDIANIFAGYYPSNITGKIANLLTEHLQIGGDLITALRDGRTMAAEELKRKWYKNANDMSLAFASINPHYNYSELQDMFTTHLDLTTNEVAARLAKNYPADIHAFNMVEDEVLRMSDYFANGLIKQFKI